MLDKHERSVRNAQLKSSLFYTLQTSNAHTFMQHRCINKLLPWKEVYFTSVVVDSQTKRRNSNVKIKAIMILKSKQQQLFHYNCRVKKKKK